MPAPSVPLPTLGRAAATLLVVSPSIDRLEAARLAASSVFAAVDSEASKIERGVHPDVLEVVPLDRKDRIGIEQIRDVIRTAHLAPTEARHKLCLIPQAEALTLEASNALLKTLEEPPGGFRFLLLASDPSDLLPTIVSRSRIIRWGSPPRAHAVDHLVASGYDRDIAIWLEQLPVHKAELNSLALSSRDIAAFLENSPRSIEEQSVPSLLDICMGEDPLLRRQALLALLLRAHGRDPDLMTEGVRLLSLRDRQDLLVLLQDLQAVCFHVTRPAPRLPAALDPLGNHVRDELSPEHLRGFCLATDSAHRSIVAYGSTEAILLSLFLSLDEEAHVN